MLKREIAIAWILTKDNQTLIGEKNQNRGVYLDKLHQPGGGKDAGETLGDALVREVKEETGLDISAAKITLIDDSQTMTTEKALPDGSKVDCEMRFHAYLVNLPNAAESYELVEGDDLIKLRFVPIDNIEIEKLTPPAIKIANILGWGR